MTFVSDRAVLLRRLDEAIRLAPNPTRDLFAKIIAGSCTRLPLLAQARGTTKLCHLADTGAWLDAALMLVELELPGWILRRLYREAGTWFCSLSHQPNVPVELDDTADGSHEAMALAILRAFLEARRTVPADLCSVVSMPVIESMRSDLVCCENFA